MTFDGFICDNCWWWGTASLPRKFKWNTPVNIIAFGALTGVEVSNGQGLAYVGIAEATVIENTGTSVNALLEKVDEALASKGGEAVITAIGAAAGTGAGVAVGAAGAGAGHSVRTLVKGKI